MTMTWVRLHPEATLEHVGLIPSFLDADDPRPAAEQFNARYQFGGWSPLPRFTLIEGLGLSYPGDPILAPLYATRLHDEIVVIYSAGFVAIVQPGGTFEVSRLD
jgi:hypothetical protein